jgi:hypothetical protein
MKAWPSSIQVRQRIAQLAAQQRTSLAWLSRAIGKPDRYLSDHVRTARPEWLEPDDRAWLARFFAVSEDDLGRRD